MRHTDKNTMQYVQKRSYVFLYKQYNLRVGIAKVRVLHTNINYSI